MMDTTRNTAMRGFYKEMVLKQDEEKFPDELPRNFFRRVQAAGSCIYQAGKAVKS